MNHPISHVVIKTSSSINPFFDLLWKMGVAENDDLEPFYKLLMGKSLKGGRGRGWNIVMVFLITHVT
jgi:hypothetical protein